MLGIAVLFPWNALITANNFWTYTFGTDSNFEFYMSAVTNWPQWISLIAFTKYGPKFSFHLRIISTLIIFAITLLIIPTICTSQLTDPVKITTTLLTCFLIGLSASVLQGTIFGLVALFPSKYMTSAMSGMGIGGVIVGILAMITQASFGKLDNGAVIQAWVYFAAASFISILAMISYIIMMRMNFAKFYVARYYLEKVKVKNENSLLHFFYFFLLGITR